MAVTKDIVAFSEFILSKYDASFIGVSGLGLVALYLFAPSLGSSVSQNIRGYTDDLPASKVIHIRNSGIPLLFHKNDLEEIFWIANLQTDVR